MISLEMSMIVRIKRNTRVEVINLEVNMTVRMKGNIRVEVINLETSIAARMKVMGMEHGAIPAVSFFQENHQMIGA